MIYIYKHGTNSCMTLKCYKVYFLKEVNFAIDISKNKRPYVRPCKCNSSLVIFTVFTGELNLEMRTIFFFLLELILLKISQHYKNVCLCAWSIYYIWNTLKKLLERINKMSKKLNKGESGSNISGSPTACKQAQKDILKSVVSISVIWLLLVT